MENLDWPLILQAVGGVVIALYGLVMSIRLVAEPMGKWKWLRWLSDWLKKLHDVLSGLTIGNQKPMSMGLHGQRSSGIVSGSIPIDEVNPYVGPPAP